MIAYYFRSLLLRVPLAMGTRAFVLRRERTAMDFPDGAVWVSAYASALSVRSIRLSVAFTRFFAAPFNAKTSTMLADARSYLCVLFPQMD